MRDLGPILRAMLRNKTGAILIAIQIAVTMTIIVNAVFIIQQRNELMARESGLDEANSFYLTSVGFADDYNPQNTTQEDLLALRALPGVVDAIQTNAVPMSGSGWSMGLQTQPGEEFDGTGVAVYMVDEHGLNTLDVELIAGRNFNQQEIRWREPAARTWPDVIIITRDMAEALFPESAIEEVVGKTVYINDDQPINIIGIIDKLQAPWVGWGSVERAMLSPEQTLFNSANYLIRTKPGQRNSLMPQIEEMLANSNKGRIIRDLTTIEDTRERSYRRHSAMIKILLIVVLTLTLVTAAGIVGLSSFTVNKRRKQIGTRRALGATKGDILRYFMLENLLISSMGIALGLALTLGLNMVLVNNFEMQRLDWYYLPFGMAVLWLLGQLAVLGPASRAAAIPPAVATRSV
ncbi:ABC transporter permease [Lacimicrobium alkaliphilum]|uniref:ABC transporter permease n=1 Tax=Lacimicrobium alkaliphilum TaxID=1526571 RepID=A0ABQ1RFU9_9ALTE|nr:FtsX-like permease family protein [Lacimicrobium alkaliphilum]GGD65338.1 ABC transporter permease [Lacimicrobium alkaliphilum]